MLINTGSTPVTARTRVTGVGIRVLVGSKPLFLRRKGVKRLMSEIHVNIQQIKLKFLTLPKNSGSIPEAAVRLVVKNGTVDRCY